MTRYEQNRGHKGGEQWECVPPMNGEGCVRVGVVPQFPHCTEEQGAVPSCGHQGAIGPHVASVPRCSASPPLRIRPQMCRVANVPSATPGPGAGDVWVTTGRTHKWLLLCGIVVPMGGLGLQLSNSSAPLSRYAGEANWGGPLAWFPVPSSLGIRHPAWGGEACGPQGPHPALEGI